MSFSANVKEELSSHITTARHCQIAELAAIIMMNGKIFVSRNGSIVIRIHTENLSVARKYSILLKRLFNIVPYVMVKHNVSQNKHCTYWIRIHSSEDAIKVLKAVKLYYLIEKTTFLENNYCVFSEKDFTLNNLIVQNACCKRSYIRGAFLVSGSVNNPEKAYHFEIVCSNEKAAEELRRMINSFNLEAKIVSRKKYFVVYIKEGSMIVDILNIMEAHISLMDMENVRIIKDVRNSVNRRVNCEAANINKTVSAAVKQVEDIKYIKESIGFDQLSDGLKEIALLRLECPEASLKELGEMLNPPVGKSGVNHRLRKLSEIASEIKDTSF